MALGLGGMAVGIIMAILVGFAGAFENGAPILIKVLMTLGFAVMLLGPLSFWLILPLWSFVRREHKRGASKGK